MNELLLSGKVSQLEKESYHVFGGSAWLYHTSWPKVGKLSDFWKGCIRIPRIEAR